MFAYNKGIHEDSGLDILHINIGIKYIVSTINREINIPCTEKEVMETIDFMGFTGGIIEEIKRVMLNRRSL